MQVERNVYDEEHELFRSTVRRFLERECVPHQAQWDASGMVSREVWRKAGKEGLLCTTLPTEYGGGGGDFGHCAIIAEELARAGVGGFSMSLHSDIVAPYINRLGTEAQKQKWLPEICRGEKILAVGITEPGGGSDVKAIRTTAVRDGDEYVINGSKTFISNGCATTSCWSARPIRLQAPGASA
jgi:acyl-CoA dehydrogenase